MICIFHVPFFNNICMLIFTQIQILQIEAYPLVSSELLKKSVKKSQERTIELAGQAHEKDAQNQEGRLRVSGFRFAWPGRR